MADDNFCSMCRENLQGQISETRRVTEKRADAHAVQIDCIERLLERMVTLQEVTEKRLSRLEDKESKPLDKAINKPLHQEKWFGTLIFTLCVIAVLLTGAAVGQNVIKEYIGGFVK